MNAERIVRSLFLRFWNYNPNTLKVKGVTQVREGRTIITQDSKRTVHVSAWGHEGGSVPLPILTRGRGNKHVLLEFKISDK